MSTLPSIPEGSRFSPYDTLGVNQSRYMVLLPGEYDAPFQCTLHPYSLDTPPHYEALSYTWGKATGSARTVTAENDLISREKKPLTAGEETVINKTMETVQRHAKSNDYLTTPDQDHAQDEHTSCTSPRNDAEYMSIYGEKYATFMRHVRHSFGRLQTQDSSTNRKESNDSTSTKPLASNPSAMEEQISIGDYKIPLQPNLGKALRHLRQPDRCRTLWIDAICINQEDDTERGQQVMYMGRIFESATAVTVWLGEASENSDDAFKLIESLWQTKVDNAVNANGACLEWKTFKMRFAPYGYFANEVITQLRALSYLGNRTWFYRRWVVQEVAFARGIMVQCGHAAMPWPQFAHAIAFLHTHYRKLLFVLRTYHLRDQVLDWALEDAALGRTSQCTTPDIRAHAAARFLFVTNGLLRKDPANRVVARLVGIDTLVTRLWALQASDPHDTVFSFMSLARDTFDSGSIVSDYSKSYCGVFAHFVQHVITATKSLDIILRPWAPVEVATPSWMPIASVGSHVGLMFQNDAVENIQDQGSHQNRLYAASGSSQPMFEIYSCGATHRLKAKGFIIGGVEKSLSGSTEGTLWSDWRPVAQDEKHWAVLIGGKTTTGEGPPPSYQSICRAIFDIWHVKFMLKWHREGPVYPTAEEDTAEDNSYSEGLNINELLDVHNGSTHDRSRLPKEYLAAISQTGDVLPFLERLRVCTWNRRLIQTSNGHWGLVPTITNIDDVVAILIGCSLPVIMRRINEAYFIVGEAYVHGMSNGEAMKDMQEGRWALEDFHIG